MAENRHFDIAVIGLGGMGAFALESATSRGMRAIGIDQFHPPHDLGSTHGQYRLIREAYSEDPAYIPFLRRAMTLWRKFSERFDGEVFFETGVQYLGPKDHKEILATHQSANEYNIPLTEIRLCPNTQKTPFIVPECWDHFFEPKAGYVNVENVLTNALIASELQGGKLVLNAACKTSAFDGEKWSIEAGSEIFTCTSIVYALGARAHEFLPFLQSHLHLERHTQHWFKTNDDSLSRTNGFRPFVAHLPDGNWFYGFPENEDGLFKVAEHNIGSTFNNWEEMDRSIHHSDQEKAVEFCKAYLPNIGPLIKSSACMYTMSPDGEFIIDYLPETEQGVFVAGLSGHGYKFAPAIGEALIDMIVEGSTKVDLSIFKMGRF